MTADSTQNPAVAETTDGGASWTTFTNLPTFASPDPNGTYLLNGISCVSALSCVAVGGLNESDGTATVISTVDGGATRARSEDPALSGVQQLFSVSCQPGPGGLPVCNAAADALQAAGPVVLKSNDGGATWSGTEALDDTGWMNSISCVDLQRCWAAGAGTKLALVGTADGNSTWSAVTSDTTNEEGRVSCATDSLCVATTDNALWVTTDDGGASAAQGRRLPAAKSPVMKALPKVSAPVTWGRIGRASTLTGQYRGAQAASSATVKIRPADGAAQTRTVKIGLNHYYSATIARLATGTTTVTYTAGNAKPFCRGRLKLATRRSSWPLPGQCQDGWPLRGPCHATWPLSGIRARMSPVWPALRAGHREGDTGLVAATAVFRERFHPDPGVRVSAWAAGRHPVDSDRNGCVHLPRKCTVRFRFKEGRRGGTRRSRRDTRGRDPASHASAAGRVRL